MNTLFLYGTQKRNQPLNYLIKDEQAKNEGVLDFIGHGRTVEQYPLVIVEWFQCPYLLNKPGLGKNIVGELYSIDDKMLNGLDVVEDYPRWYNRKSVAVSLLPGCKGSSCPFNNDFDCMTNARKILEQTHTDENTLATMESFDSATTETLHPVIYILDDFNPDLLTLSYKEFFNVKDGFDYQDMIRRHGGHDEVVQLLRKMAKKQ